MITLAEHEYRTLQRARERAWMQDAKLDAEQKQRQFIREHSARGVELERMRADFEAFERLRVHPVKEALLQECTRKLADYVSTPLHVAALRAAAKLVEGAEVRTSVFNFDFDFGERNFAATVDVVIEFMEPAKFTIRRHLARA